MTLTRERIELLLRKHGWIHLHSGGDQIVYFRWAHTPATTREEVCIIFNGNGNVHAWTRWHNTRMSPPDQQPNNRQRLEELVTSP